MKNDKITSLDANWENRLAIDRLKSHLEYLRFAGIHLDFNKCSITGEVRCTLRADFPVKDTDEAAWIYRDFAHKLHKRNERLLGKKVMAELDKK